MQIHMKTEKNLLPWGMNPENVVRFSLFHHRVKYRGQLAALKTMETMNMKKYTGNTFFKKSYYSMPFYTLVKRF